MADSWEEINRLIREQAGRAHVDVGKQQGQFDPRFFEAYDEWTENGPVQTYRLRQEYQPRQLSEGDPLLQQYMQQFGQREYLDENGRPIQHDTGGRYYLGYAPTMNNASDGDGGRIDISGIMQDPNAILRLPNGMMVYDRNNVQSWNLDDMQRANREADRDSMVDYAATLAMMAGPYAMGQFAPGVFAGSEMGSVMAAAPGQGFGTALGTGAGYGAGGMVGAAGASGGSSGTVAGSSASGYPNMAEWTTGSQSGTEGLLGHGGAASYQAGNPGLLGEGAPGWATEGGAMPSAPQTGGYPNMAEWTTGNPVGSEGLLGHGGAIGYQPANGFMNQVEWAMNNPRSLLPNNGFMNNVLDGNFSGAAGNAANWAMSNPLQALGAGQMAVGLLGGGSDSGSNQAAYTPRNLLQDSKGGQGAPTQGNQGFYVNPHTLAQLRAYGGM